ncbi:MAG: ABC transporter ATP-binding protein [Halothiobacillaceae bacterium]
MPGAGLRVRGLTHRYALDPVVEQVDLDLQPGQVMALVGPSGCGKTTLLHLCAGLLMPLEGTIENRFANTACVFQQPRLLPWKNARDNIALGLDALGSDRRTRHALAERIAGQLGLAPEDLDKLPRQLSGGMQGRVALARALVVDPDLLLLDEPFSALDIGLKESLYRLLLEQQQARGLGVLMITHDLMEAVRLSDRILVMAPEPGRIVHQFEITMPARQRDDAFVYHTTARLLSEPDVRDSFGLDAALPCREHA